MSIGERPAMMWAAILATLLLAFAAGGARAQTWRLCPTGPASCGALDRPTLDHTRPITTLETTWRPSPGGEPVAVEVIAMASSEVWWNGRLLGRNGQVGATRAAEIPGRFSAAFLVPSDWVRPGDNLVVVRLSARHLWPPVNGPIHKLTIGPYADPTRGLLWAYAPTLTVVGLIALAFARLLGQAIVRRDEETALLAIIAGLVLTQAVFEASKLALTYPYPWQALRIGGIALLSAATAVLVARMAALRFAPTRRNAVTAAAVLLAASAVWLFAGYDEKAVHAFQSGAILALACAALGVAARKPLARPAALALIAALALSLAPRGLFLDSGYYLAFAAAFCARFVADLTALGRVTRSEASLLQRTTLAEEALERARQAPSGSPMVELRDGHRTLRLAAADIAWLKAADDYVEVNLQGGGAILANGGLTELLARLPANFRRIHRSYAVNLDLVDAHGRDGGRRSVMVGGVSLPVGRMYAGALAT